MLTFEFVDASPLSGRLFVSEDALVDAVIAELMDEFFDSRRCGLEIPEPQARLIAYRVLSRINGSTRSGADPFLTI